MEMEVKLVSWQQMKRAHWLFFIKEMKMRIMELSPHNNIDLRYMGGTNY
jgi:hypothetical protein